jgi:hypothetical protein
MVFPTEGLSWLNLAALNLIPMLFGYNTFRGRCTELLHYRFLPGILFNYLRIIPIQSVWWIKLIGIRVFEISRLLKPIGFLSSPIKPPKRSTVVLKWLLPCKDLLLSLIVFHLQNQGLRLFLRLLDHYHPRKLKLN